MSDNTSKKLVPVWVLAIYSVCLYAAWTVCHFFIIPHIENIPNEALSHFMNDGVCKNLVWTLPALLLIRKHSDVLFVKSGELFTWKKEHLKYLLIFPAFIVYLIIGFLVKKETPTLSITIGEMIIVIFVGVTEELVFRAWLLNATYPYAKPPKSDEDIPWSQYSVIALNAVMFLAVHFPRWIMEGAFIENFANRGFLSILLLSVIFSLVFIKTKSIILPIALHMFWDFLIFLLY